MLGVRRPGPSSGDGIAQTASPKPRGLTSWERERLVSDLADLPRGILVATGAKLSIKAGTMTLTDTTPYRALNAR